MTLSIVAETTFGDVIRMICHIDFKFGSISFHKQRKWAGKYQHRIIVPLTFKVPII